MSTQKKVFTRVGPTKNQILLYKKEINCGDFSKVFPLKPNLSFINKNQNLNLLNLQKPNQVVRPNTDLCNDCMIFVWCVWKRQVYLTPVTFKLITFKIVDMKQGLIKSFLFLRILSKDHKINRAVKILKVHLNVLLL